MVSQHALQVLSQQVSERGGGIPACLAGFQAVTQGEVKGSGHGGSPGPHLEGVLQAHTPGRSPGPHPGGCIPACTEADPPMATASGSTHPTGMNSCFF